MLRRSFLGASASIFESGHAARAAAESVDTLLVLAIDGSGSLTDERITLQRAGHAAAVTSAAFLDAVAMGLHGRVALAAVEWSNQDRQILTVPWTVLHDAATAQRFGTALMRAPRPIPGFTSISGAIDFSVGLLSRAGHPTARRVIDISGNGVNNDGRPAAEALAAAVADGVTVNGLPILDAVPNLDEYFAREVVGGTGAFLVVAHTIAHFEAAIRRKLVVEISAVPPSWAAPA